MNLNQKLVTLAATVALSAGAVFAVPAQDGRASRAEARAARMFHRGAGKIVKALNLTDAQREQAKAIRQRHRASNQTLREELRQIHQQIRTARQANNMAEAQRLAASREPMLARVREARQAQQAEFRSLLTTEQQTKLEELGKSRQNRRQFRRK